MWVAAVNFGIRFDLRNPHSPESLAEAVKYVLLWAKREGIEIPEGLEPVVHRNEADPKDWRTYSTMYVGFEVGGVTTRRKTSQDDRTWLPSLAQGDVVVPVPQDPV